MRYAISLRNLENLWSLFILGRGALIHQVNSKPEFKIKTYSNINIVKQDLIEQIRNLGSTVANEIKNNQIYKEKEPALSEDNQLLLPKTEMKNLYEKRDIVKAFWGTDEVIDMKYLDDKQLYRNMEKHVDEILNEIDINMSSGMDSDIEEMYEKAVKIEFDNRLNKKATRRYFEYLKAQGEYQRGIELARQYLKHKNQSGNILDRRDDLECLASLLSGLFSEQEQFFNLECRSEQETEQLYREILKIDHELIEKGFTEESEDLAKNCIALAQLIFSFDGDEENYTEVKRLYREALDIRQRIAAENPSKENEENLVSACYLMADFLENFGVISSSRKFCSDEDQTEEENVLRKALDIRRRQSSDNFSIDSLENLASSYLALVKFLENRKNEKNQKEEEKLYREILNIRRIQVDENSAAFDQDSTDNYMAVVNLASSCHKLADLLRNNKDEKNQNEAKMLYQEATDIRRRLFMEAPSIDNERDLAESCEDLADFLKNQKDAESLADAVKLYREVLRIYHKLAKEDLPELEYSIPIVCNQLGALLSCYKDAESLAEAEDLYREALDIGLSYAKDFLMPESILAFSCSKLAGLLVNKGDYKSQTDAEDLYRVALDISRRLIDEDPSINTYAQLALSCNDLANFLSNRKGLEEWDEAEKLFREALDFTHRLALVNPSDYEPDLALVCHNLADFLKEHRGIGSLAEAKALYQKALEIRHRLAKEDSSFYEDVALISENLANLFSKDNDVACQDKALALYLEVLEIRRRLAKENPSIKNMEDLATTCINLANLLILQKSLNDQIEAENLYREALDIDRRLVNENPTADNKKQLASTCAILVHLLRNRNDCVERNELADLNTEARNIWWEFEDQDPDRFKSISRFSSARNSHVKADNRPKSYNGEKPYLFISYAHKNDFHVFEIIRGLQKRGIRVCYDESIELGKNWGAFIESHIKNCYCFCAMLTEEFMKSGTCQNELNTAMAIYKKPSFLVYLQEIQRPFGLNIMHGTTQDIFYNDFEDEEKFLDKIARAELLNKCRE